MKDKLKVAVWKVMEFINGCLEFVVGGSGSGEDLGNQTRKYD